MGRPLAQALRARAPALSIGVISADMMALGRDLGVLEREGADLLHVDVMDGRFVPMLTVGPVFLKGLKTTLPKDVHLYVEEPLGLLADFAAAGADLLTIHPESCRHPHRALQAIASLKNANDPGRGILAGVGLDPGTPLSVLEPLLPLADLVYVVAVNPGFAGQKYIPESSRRLADVRAMIAATGRDILLAIDGGVTRANIAEVAALKPDLIVTGSAVFDGDAAANLRQMRQASRAGMTV